MVGIPKLRIKFGPEGYVRTFQTFPGSAKKIEHSVDDDLSHSAERSKKRGANELEDVQAKKKQKLDSDVSSQCLELLRLLMEHRVGWIFNTPVDPVELKIPDYFSVILKPMDLGTVKSKLLKNEYGNTDEFAADVLLTFTNAMLYNPPDNWVHKIGKEMKEIFEVRWELLKKKKVSELSGIEGSKRQPVEVDCSRQRSPRTTASSRIFSVGLTKPAKENLEKVSLSSKQVKMQIKKDCQVKNTSGAQASELEPQPNGSVTSRIERTGSVNSQLDKASNSALLDNELKTASAALPPVPSEKALRAAMLKAQYADTILKAKQRKVLDQNNKADLIGRQIEKEEMERTQREEKARIEAGVRAAKIAAQMRTQAELKEKRERQQLELAKVGKSFDFERHNHLKVEKDFVRVCGCSSLEIARLTHEELGLFLENEYWPELEEIGSEICYAMRLDDLEEGEIL